MEILSVHHQPLIAVSRTNNYTNRTWIVDDCGQYVFNL